jgi:galactose-1-phosphate uridylyltransferase
MIAESIPPATEPKVVTTPLGSAYPVLSTSTVVAFLDIAPVTPGHILLCPRRHCEKATDMTAAEAAALGVWLPVLTRALLKVLGTTMEDASWNIIQANGKSLGTNVFHDIDLLCRIRSDKRFRILTSTSYPALEVHVVQVTLRMQRGRILL